jgi:hypothetical protein
VLSFSVFGLVELFPAIYFHFVVADCNGLWSFAVWIARRSFGSVML